MSRKPSKALNTTAGKRNSVVKGGENDLAAVEADMEVLLQSFPFDETVDKLMEVVIEELMHEVFALKEVEVLYRDLVETPYASKRTIGDMLTVVRLGLGMVDSGESNDSYVHGSTW
jgi:hypothetical protein